MDLAGKDMTKEKALANVRQSLRNGVRLPENAFFGRWESHRFLVSDNMFDEEFVVAIKELLEIEGGRTACLVNLDRPNLSYSQEVTIYLDAESDPVVYNEVVQGFSVGYVFRERFGCSSDIGSWCFYCENKADVAVLAIRRSSDVERFRVPLE